MLSNIINGLGTAAKYLCMLIIAAHIWVLQSFGMDPGDAEEFIPTVSIKSNMCAVLSSIVVLM